MTLNATLLESQRWLSHQHPPCDACRSPESILSPHSLCTSGTLFLPLNIDQEVSSTYCKLSKSKEAEVTSSLCHLTLNMWINTVFDIDCVPVSLNIFLILYCSSIRLILSIMNSDSYHFINFCIVVPCQFCFPDNVFRLQHPILMESQRSAISAIISIQVMYCDGP